MVGFDFQVIRLEFNRHMAVSQVVGRAGQVKGAAVRSADSDAQDRLRRRDDLDHGTIFGNQHITAAHQGAARQEDAELAAQRVGRLEAAFLADIPVEFDCGCALEQNGRQAGALRHDFGNLKHVENSVQKRK